MSRFARYVIAAALLGLLGAIPHSIGAQTLSPGAEVFAVDPARVIEVTYRSSGMMLIAHRWQTRDRFTLIILDQRNSEPVTCLAGPGFDIVLNQLTSLKLRRVLNAREAKELLKKNPVSLWAEVVVRDNTAVEAFRALLMQVPGVPDEAFVHFNGVTYVVDFADQVSKLISSGCKLLAAPSPNRE
jgi:hypothetical protein